MTTSSVLVSLLVFFFLAVSVVMILTVLIQRPQGGGLSGAFGAGGGSGQTAFGAKTGDALTIATVTIFILWLATAIGLVFALRPMVATAGVPGAAESAVEEGADGAEVDADGADGALPIEVTESVAPQEVQAGETQPPGDMPAEVPAEAPDETPSNAASSSGAEPE